MKSNVLTILAVAGIFGGLLVLNNYQPDRRTDEQIERSEEVAETNEEAVEVEEQYAQNQSDAPGEAAPPVTLGADVPLPEVPEIPLAENTQRYLFETTKGFWILDVFPDWAPIGAEQFEKAVNAGVYNGAGVFRVIPGFVIQFGIPGDPELANEWNEKRIQDESVMTANERGTITFAKSAQPNSRTTQLFINLGNNQQLDRTGFAPFGKIVHGMDVVDAINAEYGERPKQDMVQRMGTAYLRGNFPRLDYIQRVTKIADNTGDTSAEAPAEN